MQKYKFKCFRNIFAIINKCACIVIGMNVNQAMRL